MKKLFFILLTFFSFALASAQNVLPRPNPPRLVNDAAGVLSAEQVATLENKLIALDDSTSNQIAIVLIKTLNDQPIEEYATKLFREWGIGNKKTNNGVLIIAAIDDRKVRIEVGYGLEGAIPDVIASDIYHNEIVPEFKQQNYYQGLNNAVDALIKAAAGEYKQQSPRTQHATGRGNTAGAIFTFIILAVFVIIILSRGGRGGGGGGGLGSIANAVILSSLLGGGRSGGGWGGGGGGGFGGGGGGFGGFGGGSSGGGGAGGSW